MIRTTRLTGTHGRARRFALLCIAGIAVALPAKGQSARKDSLPWGWSSATPVKPWFPLLGQRAELPYWTDSSLEQRNTCPMPVAHSQIVDPMPVSGKVSGLPDSVLSAARLRAPEGSTRGMPVMHVPPCYNPLDVKKR